MCGYDPFQDRPVCDDPPIDRRGGWTLFWLFLIALALLSITFAA